MLVALAAVAVFALIICVVYAIAQNSTAGLAPVYAARHRAPGRVSWLAEATTHLRTHADRARRAAYLRLMVIPAVVEESTWIAELAATEATGELDQPGLGGAGRYAHLRTEELDSTAERVYRLAELGIRPPSPWGTPECDDVWEPALVTAA